MKYFFYTMAFLVFCVLTIGGLRGMKFTSTPIELFPDMDRQPKVKAQVPSDFYADGLGMRQPVDGTVPRTLPGGQISPPVVTYFATGKVNEGLNWGDGIPIKISMKDLKRGQERYNINCAICHGKSGNGDGIIKQYGLATIASIVNETISSQPDGQIFDTITNGKGTMGAYGHNITNQDRWKIIAYLRALQRSQGSPADTLPEDLKVALMGEADSAVVNVASTANPSDTPAETTKP